jgi:hypothetical protein
MDKLQLSRISRSRQLRLATWHCIASLQLTTPQKTLQRYRLDLHRFTTCQEKGCREFFPVDLSIEPVRALHNTHSPQPPSKFLVGDVALLHLLYQQLMRDSLPLRLNLRLRLHPSPAPLRLKSIGILVIINRSIGRIRLVCSLYPISHLYDSVSNYWKH